MAITESRAALTLLFIRSALTFENLIGAEKIQGPGLPGVIGAGP